MIATQLYPVATFPENRDLDTAQYHPAKDVESFKKLLPPPIEFVEGSSSGTLAIGDGKYQPINATPTSTQKVNTSPDALAPPSSPSSPSSSRPTPQTPSGADKSLWSRPIDTSWPTTSTTGCGLNNIGNTCFLNSVLQCLIHTPALVRILSLHGQADPCRVKKGAFCMTCALKSLMRECFARKVATTPYQIVSKLSEIAKHMRRGRQEDSHEFLRYAVDSMQKSCLAGNEKVEHKIAVTTWVHKLFGGKLRSRVACLSCGYNSDTFDDILDLSVDIYGADSLQKALRKFVAVDHLKGADKYKCEKCKKHVSADKSFTVHEAPAILTIHLKRFTPMGRKISQPIRYDEQLSLQPIMSEGQFGPTYSLYGVISHAGGGPNSGHYYAHVKNSKGDWYEMNDESVTRTFSATNMKNAYILFYVRSKGQALEAAVSAPTVASKKPTPAPAPAPAPAARTGLVAGMKKRKIVEDDDDDAPTPAFKLFIGPLLPSPTINCPPSPPNAKKLKLNPPDPQAALLKQKIAAASQPKSPVKASALLSLSQYNDDDSSDNDLGEKVEKKEDPAEEKRENDGDAVMESSKPTDSPAISTDVAPKSPMLPSPTLTEPTLPPSSAAASSMSSAAVSVASFYSTEGSRYNKGKSRETADSDDGGLNAWARTPLTPTQRTPQRSHYGGGSNRHSSGGYNPYTRLNGSNNLRQHRDGGSSSAKKFRKRSMAV